MRPTADVPLLELSVSTLAAALPAQVPPFPGARRLNRMSNGAVACTLLGYACVFLAREGGPARAALNGAGLLLVLLGVLLLVAAVGGLCIAAARLGTPERVFDRLDENWRSERALIAELRRLDATELRAFGRYVRLQAQLFDRTVTRSTLLGVISAALAALLPLLTDAAWFAQALPIAPFVPAALVLGAAAGAMAHQDAAARLLRMERLVSEAVELGPMPRGGAELA